MSDLVKSQGLEMTFFDPAYIQTLETLSARFADSDMVPDFYKSSGKDNTPEKARANCFIALNMAFRLKADPLMVMQNMKPIMGSPSLSAQFIIALINNSGRFEELKFEFVSKGNIKDVAYTDYENAQTQQGKWYKKAVEKKFAGPVENLACVCWTTRKGEKERIEGPEVSILMAIQEGWYTKNGSKWPNMTRLMLSYRAATQWKSINAPHITMGLPSTEELVDVRPIEEAEFEDMTSQVKQAAKARETVKIEVPQQEEALNTVTSEMGTKVDAETGEVIKETPPKNPSKTKAKPEPPKPDPAPEVSEPSNSDDDDLPELDND